MNTDDFEKRLQHQPLQQPPATWRGEILTAAHANLPTSAIVRESELLAGWRALLARIPVAWGAVAALWLIIIGTNALMSGPAITVMASSSASAPREGMTVWQWQRMEAGLLANGPTDFPDLAPPRETPAAPPRPRSDRRREEGLRRSEAMPQHLTMLA